MQLTCLFFQGEKGVDMKIAILNLILCTGATVLLNRMEFTYRQKR